MARTNNLTDFLSDVADAIRAKKGTSETILASDFDTEIENLPSGGGDLDEYFNTINIKSYNDFVRGIPDFTISAGKTDLTQFFQYKTPIVKIGKITFGNNITDLGNMFSGCTNLTAVDLSGGNTSNVTYMGGMFMNCSKLLRLDLSNFNTLNVSNMSNMFNGCKALTYIDLRGFDFSNTTAYTNMFGASASNGVPDNCEIIVADDTQKTWITSKFSRLTNVKTVAEYEAEQNA